MNDHDTEPQEASTPPRHRARWIRRIVLGLMLAATLTFAGAFYLLRTPAASWQRYERFKATHTTEQIEELAEKLEVSLHDLIEQDLPPELRSGAEKKAIAKAPRPDQLDGAAGETPDETGEDGENVDPTMIRIDEVRVMKLTRDELTALVAARHEQWLDSRGYVKPNDISDLMIDLEDGRMVASFKYEGRQFSQVFSAKFRMNFEDDGTAIVRLESFSAGRLPVPTDQIGSYLREKGGSSSAEATGEWLQKLDNFRFKPVLDDLPHRRRARILGYKINKEEIELTLRVQDHRTYQEMNREHEATARAAMASGE